MQFERLRASSRASCVAAGFGALLTLAGSALAAPPDGSTLVPPRAAFEKSLGSAPAADASPEAIASALCAPNVGSPTTSPSSVDVAIGPTTGVIVSSAGYLTFSKSNPADCANNTVTPLETFFATAMNNSSGPLYDPRVVYDPHIGRFVIVAVGPQTGNPNTTYLYYAVSDDNTGTTWTNTNKREDPAFGVLVDSVTLGFAQGFILVAMSSTTANSARFRDIPDAAPYRGGSGGENSNLLNIVAPRVMDNSTTAFFLAVSGGTVSRISNTAGNSPYTIDTITVPAFSVPPAVTQANGQKLNSGTGNFVGSSVQIGNSIWNVQPVGVAGHARFRVYKFSTTATTPVMTFTPTIMGTEDLFNATLATGSETAGSRAFVSASEIEPGTAGPSFLAFTGPNDSTQAWSYDVVAHAAFEYTGCGAGCAWVPSSGAAMDPSDTSKAWVANQLTSGTAATNWTVAAAAVSGSGDSHPPGPIASSAGEVSDSGFTANWGAQSTATGYQLDVATDDSFTTSTSDGAHPASLLSGYPKDVGNVTSFAVTGLSAGTTYYYRVRGIGDFTSDSSNTVSVTTNAATTTAIGPLELLALSLLGFAGLGLRSRRA